VVYGDTPLLTAATLQRLVEHHAVSGNAATFLAMDVADPSGYGRMLLDAQGYLERIVEERDAAPHERAIHAGEFGCRLLDIQMLLAVLPRLKATTPSANIFDGRGGPPQETRRPGGCGPGQEPG